MRLRSRARSAALAVSQIRRLQGWCKDALPSAPSERLGIQRLDRDRYGTTIRALNAFSLKVCFGGFAVIDDVLAPCKQPVHDYRDQHCIGESIRDIMGIRSFWRYGC